MSIDERDQFGRTPLHYAAIDPPTDLKHIAAQSDPERAAQNQRVSEQYRIANTTRRRVPT